MKGKLVIIAGPSASGKTLLLRTLLDRVPDSVKFITTTTRPPREDETNGKDYYFVTREEFEKEIKNNNFLEYIEYSGNMYGTHKNNLDALLNQHEYVFSIVDVRGVKVLKKYIPEACAIFIHPGSLEMLKKRLMAVRVDATQAQLEKRLAIAEHEMAEAATFDHVVYNLENKFDDTVKQVLDILKL